MASHTYTPIYPHPFVEALSLRSTNSLMFKIAAVLCGVLLLSLLAQVRIPVPYSPVPITGQTFGMLVIGSLWGLRLGVTTFLAYLALGAVGAPVFAAGTAAVFLGPSSGYLLGMLLGVYFVGFFADRGVASSFIGAAVIGSLAVGIVFILGLTFLSAIVPAGFLLTAGLYPFIPGELTKIVVAAVLVSAANRTVG